MRRATLRSSNLAVALGVASLFAIGYPAEVRAQTIFCPPTFSGLQPFLCQTGRAPMAMGRALFRAPRWPVRRLPKYLRRRPK